MARAGSVVPRYAGLSVRSRRVSHGSDPALRMTPTVD